MRAGRRFLAAAGLLAAALAPACAKPSPGIAAECPAQAAALVEHFISADCLACWQGEAPVAAGEWSLDWITPAADDAAMAPGAMPEAADRLARLGRAAPSSSWNSRTVLETPAARHRFYVHSSLPHRGYLGVQLHATGVWPEGSSGWMALVELIPAGTRDTPQARRLVRVLVGPLNLPDKPGANNAVAPLYALRWPENAHAENLVATAWVEAADGHVTQIVTDRCADPK